MLTIPTTTEPCFTASDAYSTWKIRPWGELGAVSHTLQSVYRLLFGGVQGDGVIVVVIPEHLDGGAASAAGVKVGMEYCGRWMGLCFCRGYEEVEADTLMKL